MEAAHACMMKEKAEREELEAIERLLRPRKRKRKSLARTNQQEPVSSTVAERAKVIGAICAVALALLALILLVTWT